MIEIRPLEVVSHEDLQTFGFNGFKTNQVMSLSEEKTLSKISFSLELINLKTPYIKEWPLSPKAHESINETREEGLSFGAYENHTLVAFVLATRIKWNNSLWIENIRVSEAYKGRGLAKVLMGHLESFAKEKQFRVIGLEVMASNVAAIQLYKGLDYSIDGFDKSHYPTREEGKKEIALFMKRYLQELI